MSTQKLFLHELGFESVEAPDDTWEVNEPPPDVGTEAFRVLSELLDQANLSTAEINVLDMKF